MYIEKHKILKWYLNKYFIIISSCSKIALYARNKMVDSSNKIVEKLRLNLKKRETDF